MSCTTIIFIAPIPEDAGACGRPRRLRQSRHATRLIYTGWAR